MKKEKRKLRLETSVVLRPYEIGENDEGKPAIISVLDRTKLTLDPELLRAVDAIKETRTLAEAASLHKERGGGHVEIVKLAIELGRKGFLHSVDGIEVEKPDITLDSKIEFFEYEVHREAGRDPMLGCTLTRRFIEVDEDTLIAMKAIEESRSLHDAEALMFQRTGEDYDLIELVAYLAQRDFVRAVDGIDVKPPVAIAREKHRLLHSVQPHHVAWVKSNAALLGVGAIVAAWIAMMVMDPTIRPGVRRFFWTNDELLVLLTGFGLSILITYGHELAHFFMARAYGIESTVSISHRFYMVVLITDVTNAWKLSKGPRIRIFLAGVLYNLALAGLLGIAAGLVRWGFLPGGEMTVNFLLFLQVLNFFPITFQFFLYARTDFYYVIATLLGERNLSADSQAFLRYRIGRVWRRLTGKPQRACAACPALVLHDDPLCFKCGASQPVADANKYPFTYRSRRQLTTFGFVMIGGRIWMYMNFFTIGWLMQIRFLGSSMQRLDAAFDAGSVWSVAKAELLLFLVVMQAAFISYFFLGDMVRTAWKGLVKLGQRLNLRATLSVNPGGGA